MSAESKANSVSVENNRGIWKCQGLNVKECIQREILIQLFKRD